LTPLPCPLLSGAAALRVDVPWARELWIGEFLAALAQEAEDGTALLGSLEGREYSSVSSTAGSISPTRRSSGRNGF
jgi:hypothetical protein